MNKNVFRLLFSLLIASSLFLLNCKSKDKVQIELQKIAQTITKDCPIQNDPLVRMDSCRALPNRILEYNYTLLFSSSQMDTLSFSGKAKESLLYNIQSTNEMRYLRDNKVTFQYLYKDDQGNDWVSILITAEDYDKPAVKPKQTSVFDIVQGEASSEDILQNVVLKMKKYLPIDFKEADITLLDCKVLPKNTLGYVYKLQSVSSEEIDTIQYKREKLPELLGSLRSDNIAQSLSVNNVFIKYIYLDKDGEYLLTFDISPLDYKKD